MKYVLLAIVLVRLVTSEELDYIGFGVVCETNTTLTEFLTIINGSHRIHNEILSSIRSLHLLRSSLSHLNNLNAILILNVVRFFEYGLNRAAKAPLKPHLKELFLLSLQILPGNL